MSDTGADKDASAEIRASAEDDTAGPRQPIVRQRGARRARLLPAPNTDPSPDVPIEREEGGTAPSAEGSRGENDDRLRRDRPPHW
ncbi:hypothetical protein [Cryobacterium tagatosivorans]|uniref:Uncharacterized protein n=1 Tax=Cryobacterium tagatosivorans TaxID=1259199 RepID=A0A4R8UIY3_9MICO|nr:hypothetical protein [Cryobacterium tagatosivorans]TFB55181.1 hypothetical protein E3O23_02855 [Cryobacterium tagatosivorans]